MIKARPTSRELNSCQDQHSCRYPTSFFPLSWSISLSSLLFRKSREKCYKGGGGGIVGIDDVDVIV